jgi:hypothetical protein
MGARRMLDKIHAITANVLLNDRVSWGWVESVQPTAASSETRCTDEPAKPKTTDGWTCSSKS